MSQPSITLLPFALSLYQQGDIESLCLKLQDEHGAHVNSLLWTCWVEQQACDAERFPLSHGLLQLCEHAIIRPLRGVRRRCKREGRWLWCREILKGLELKAEVWQLRTMERRTELSVVNHESRILDRYLTSCGLCGAELDAAAQLLRCAAEQVWTGR